MKAYYMVSNIEIAETLKMALLQTYDKMEKITSDRELRIVLNRAPAFIFKKTSDFIEAIKCTHVALLIKPDLIYSFEILTADTKNKKLIINSVEVEKINENEMNDILLTEFPLEIN